MTPLTGGFAGGRGNSGLIPDVGFGFGSFFSDRTGSRR
jgi:hypothetical protein